MLFLNPFFYFFSVKQLNNQLIGVGNFVVTVLGAFAFGYKGTEYAFAGSGNDTFPLVGLLLKCEI